MQRGASPGQHKTQNLPSRGRVCLGAEGIIGTVICHGEALLLLSENGSLADGRQSPPPPSGWETCVVV